MKAYPEFEIIISHDFCKILVHSHLAAAPLITKFKEIIDEAIQKESCEKILFDLSKVEFVDSSFIGAIVYAYKILSKINGKISCYISNSYVYDRFLISQLDKLFSLRSTIQEAIQDLQKP